MAAAMRTPPPVEEADLGDAVNPMEAVVQQWNEAGGYGFLALDDGRRVYIHRSNLGGDGSLVVGHRLLVTILPDKRNPGKWSVGEVLAGGDALVVEDDLAALSPSASKRRRVNEVADVGYYEVAEDAAGYYEADIPAY